MPTLNEVAEGKAKGESNMPKEVARLAAEVCGPDSPALWYSLTAEGDTNPTTEWEVVVLSGDTKLVASGEVDSNGWRLKGVELYEGE